MATAGSKSVKKRVTKKKVAKKPTKRKAPRKITKKKVVKKRVTKKPSISHLDKLVRDVTDEMVDLGDIETLIKIVSEWGPAAYDFVSDLGSKFLPSYPS